jgi:hypothetical protein
MPTVWRISIPSPADRTAFSTWTDGRDFLRLWRRDHFGRRRNHNVRTGLGQVGPLFGLRLFQWRGRTDHIRLGNGDWLFGLRSVRHDAMRTRESSRSFRREPITNLGADSEAGEAQPRLKAVASSRCRSARYRRRRARAHAPDRCQIPRGGNGWRRSRRSALARP